MSSEFSRSRSKYPGGRRISRRSRLNPMEPTSAPCSSWMIDPENKTGICSPFLATSVVSKFLTLPFSPISSLRIASITRRASAKLG